jgi:membrane protein required for colicin V production
MPSYVDLGVLAVILISALLAMVRGFTREVLAIASWAAAAVAAIYLHPMVEPYLVGYPYMDKENVRPLAAMAIIFLVTLVLVSIVTVKLSDLVLDSKIGALDRSLGFVFGAARGFLLCVIAFMFFQWLVQGDEPAMSKNARMRPVMIETGEKLIAMLPDMTFLNKLMKSRTPSGEEAPADAPADSSPAPTPPQKRTEAPAAAPTRVNAATPERRAQQGQPVPQPARQAQDNRAQENRAQENRAQENRAMDALIQRVGGQTAR